MLANTRTYQGHGGCVATSVGRDCVRVQPLSFFFHVSSLLANTRTYQGYGGCVAASVGCDGVHLLPPTPLPLPRAAA